MVPGCRVSFDQCRSPYVFFSFGYKGGITPLSSPYTGYQTLPKGLSDSGPTFVHPKGTVRARIHVAAIQRLPLSARNAQIMPRVLARSTVRSLLRVFRTRRPANKRLPRGDPYPIGADSEIGFDQ